MRKHGIAIGLDSALIAALVGLPTMPALSAHQMAEVERSVPKYHPPVEAKPYTGINRQQRRAMQSQENKRIIAHAKKIK